MHQTLASLRCQKKQKKRIEPTHQTKRHAMKISK